MRRKTTLYFFVFIALAMNLRAQSTVYIAVSDESIYYSTPFVINPFESIPYYGLPGDSLNKFRGFLKSNVMGSQTSVHIDDDWKFITISETINGHTIKMPFTASLDWYFNNKIKHNSKNYFLERLPMTKKISTVREGVQRKKSLELVGVDLGDLGRASLRINGNVTVAGKMIYQDQELTTSSFNESQNARFDIDQKQHLNIEGTIGDRVSVSMDQDSERDFDWENNIRITYNGKEDEILQRVEAGNTSLSLPATQFVTFTGNSQGLFGVKAISKLGPIDITSIAAVEQTKKAKQNYKGAGQSQTQKIKDYEYVKNQYFFIHEWFRNGISTSVNGKPIDLPSYYPLDEEGRHLRGDFQVADFELYKLDISNNPAADVGTAYIDPANKNEYATYNKEGTFLRMERDVDYFLSVDLGYLRLRSRSQDQILACSYVLVNNTTKDTVLTVGHDLIESDSTLVLKMLKPQSPHPNHPTWDLMFKNVYNLGATNIDSTGFAVRIINNRATIESDRDASGTYINQFGVDSKNENGAKIPDDKIDIDNIVFLNFGEMHLPVLLPFVSTNQIEGGNTNEDLASLLGEGKMYTSTVHSEYTGDSRFTIEADYSNLSSTINLGFMIVEGSEEVFEDGQKLVKNMDYTIDYFSGTINIIKQNINPNADINVNYEKNELVSFDKKVILGSRAQMDFGENAFIGATALYYNQSVIDEKIEVGYEPMRNFIWDINGRYGKDLDRLTYYLDKLPLIKTDAMSSFSIEGEFAQVFPNPNSVSNSATGDGNGLAYIDDFEGSKRSNSPSVRYERWEPSSAPIDLNSGMQYRQKNRAKMYWYSPFTKYPTKSIWPNQSTSAQANDQTVDILILNYKTLPHQVNVERDSLWAGIISPFYSGSYDQTQSKFFEIWIKGNDGNLTVDLGKISEDWNGDGVLNTEDKAEAGFVQGNDILDNGEDVGLDGARDDYEDGWGGALDSTGLTFQQYLANGETVFINPDVEDIEDPNSDNWFYDDQQNISNYTKVNGTQGNINASGGRYPDTEDLDRSGFIDKTNNYFTKTFPLDQSKYFVTETEESDGTQTGWQLFRIPLTHFEQVNTVDWSEIRYIRLVWSGVEEASELGIAKIELVGNDWQELGIADGQSDTFTKSDSAFAITVINTEDNPEYTPPKGVKGEYNPIYDTRSKEQSLVLKFEDLPANNRGAAKKTLFSLTGERAQSYLTYDSLKMYVYGEESQWINSQNTDVELFLQFGLGDQYYEITQPVYSGWDEDQNRNAVNLDLDWLTNLKLQDSTSVKLINDKDVFKDSSDIKQYYFTDEHGSLTGKKITIKGEPAMSRIQHFIVGIRNNANEPITGQVWVDELRLSGVKKEKGVAMRVQSSLQLADFGKTSVVYSRRDADFHVLQQRLGTNKTNESVRVNTSLQMQKFLPESWGISIPMNIAYSSSINSPKYYPGSDVRVNTSAVPDSIIDQSEIVSFSTTFAKTSKSKNKWIKYTLDDITGSFSSNKALTSNEIMKEVRNESYTGKLAYSHSFPRDNFFKPLKWLKIIPLLGEKISETNFYYTPTNLNAGIDFSEKLIQKDSRAGGRSPDEYNLGLNRTFNLFYKITDNLEVKYNRGSKSDMDEFRAEIIRAIQDWDPGVITNTNENLSTTFNPVIAEWLKPNFTYSAAYRWDQPRSSTIDGANIGTQLRFSSNLSLSMVSILETVYKPKQTTIQRSGTEQKRRQRRVIEEQENNFSSDKDEIYERKTIIDEEKDELLIKKGEHVTESGLLEEDLKKPKDKIKLLAGFHKILKKVNPINMTYSSNLNRTGIGVQGDVPIGYKFGWLPDHGLQHSESIGTNTGQWNLMRNLSLRSGFAISTKTNINLSYVQELGINRSGGTDLELHSLSRDYFSYGERLDKGLPFTSWTIRVTGLEKLPLLNKFTKSVSLEHAFSGKEVRSWKIEGEKNIPTTQFFGITEFANGYSDYLVQSRVNSSYSPLIGLTMSLPKGISVNVRHNLSNTAEKSPTGLTLKKQQSVSMSSNYTHKGGFTIPLPFIDNYKVQNTMNFTINADYSLNQTFATKNSPDLAVIDRNENKKIGLRISYSFSSRVTGAVILEYRESDSKHVGKKIDRDIGFDLNLAISG